MVDKDRAKGVGLGFEQGASQADMQAISQIARLKKHYAASKPTAPAGSSGDNLDAPSHRAGGKADLHSKKRSIEAKELLLLEKKEKRRDKKQRQKLQEQKATHEEGPQDQQQDPAQPITQGPQQLQKVRQGKELQALLATGLHFKKSMLKKTRSKQKNRRKDNRPLEEKRQKLAEKGVEI